MSSKQEHLLQLYKNLNQLSPISQSSWDYATPFFQLLDFEKDKHLFEAENKVENLFFMTKGLARYYYLTLQGKEFNKSFAVAGNVVSSISSLVQNTPSPFFVQCLSSCSFLSIKYKDFLNLTYDYSEFGHLAICMLEKLAMKKERREADFLLLCATKRYEKFLDDYSNIVKLLPNYHIASYLGITEVALSRIRRGLGLT